MSAFLAGLLWAFGAIIAIGAALGLTVLPGLFVAFLATRRGAEPHEEEAESFEIEEGSPITNGHINPSFFK